MGFLFGVALYLVSYVGLMMTRVLGTIEIPCFGFGIVDKETWYFYSGKNVVLCCKRVR